MDYTPDSKIYIVVQSGLEVITEMEISLALGGGGAKGIAHLGVLRFLEKHGFQVKAISGTSAGGIVAALFAAGYSSLEILERFKEVDQSSLYGRRPGDGPSILGVAGINHILKEMLGERTFDEMSIPCSLTAVDLGSETEVILKKGRVVDAILSTIALPGIFPPQQWEGRILVDGGLLDPVPVVPARELAPHLPVVAVVLTDLNPRLHNVLEPPAILAAYPLLREISRLRVAQAFNIFLHSADLSSRYLTLLRLKMDKPDVVIQPKLSHIGILDRVDVAELAEIGEIAAEAALPKLERALGFSARVRRYLRSLRSSSPGL